LILVKINFNNINKVHIIYGKNNMLDKLHSERLILIINLILVNSLVISQK